MGDPFGELARQTLANSQAQAGELMSSSANLAHTGASMMASGLQAAAQRAQLEQQKVQQANEEKYRKGQLEAARQDRQFLQYGQYLTHLKELAGTDPVVAQALAPEILKTVNSMSGFVSGSVVAAGGSPISNTRQLTPDASVTDITPLQRMSLPEGTTEATGTSQNGGVEAGLARGLAPKPSVHVFESGASASIDPTTRRVTYTPSAAAEREAEARVITSQFAQSLADSENPLAVAPINFNAFAAQPNANIAELQRVLNEAYKDPNNPLHLRDLATKESEAASRALEAKTHAEYARQSGEKLERSKAPNQSGKPSAEVAPYNPSTDEAELKDINEEIAQDATIREWFDKLPADQQANVKKSDRPMLHGAKAKLVAKHQEITNRLNAFQSWQAAGAGPGPDTPAAAGAGPSAPQPVTTQQQFDALDSGTIYFGKDGRQYRKP